MTTALSISSLSKTYKNGFRALDDVSLSVAQGEIFALLGPNGAGKTTLIGSVCGIVRPSAGQISVFGQDNISNYKQARNYIGLVPQELTTDAFETVFNTVSFSRGLFGKKKNPDFIEEVLKKLSLWDKKDAQIRMLSGGMKRRVMIAKALSHEPRILFLDEPSAGVDVELRKSMWEQVRMLRDMGVTIILTTHYIEEAEEMADRVGVISKGKLILTEEKNTLMKKLGKKELHLHLYEALHEIPAPLSCFNLRLAEDDDNKTLIFTYDANRKNNDVTELLDHLKENNIRCIDIESKQSSLEEIFVGLVNNKENA